MKENEKATESQLWNFRANGKKKQKQTQSKLENIHIPQEIVDNILPRLSVKSLLRFKCVCKRWYSTISSPNFDKRGSELVFAMVKMGSILALYSIDDDLAKLEPVPVPWDEEDVSYEQIIVSNSCNGLVLLGFSESLFLFNPLTRFFAKVLELHCLTDEDYSTNIGLCYDESINDYKVVVIGFSQHDPSSGGQFVIVASIKCKRWTEISFPFDVNFAIKGPLLNGRLHWTAYNVIDDDDDVDDDDDDDDDNDDDDDDDDNDDDDADDNEDKRNKIICFDPRLNVFEMLPSPPLKRMRKEAILGLGVLQGCLCLARTTSQHFYANIEILVMKEYSVVGSWINMFVFSNLKLNRYLDVCVCTPLLFTKNGEVVLSINSREILAWNLKYSYRRFCIPTHGEVVHDFPLLQSIVSPVEYNWDLDEHKDLGSTIEWQKS